MSVSHVHSMIKSIVWRLIGIIVLATITYIFTKSLIQSSLITFLHHFSFIIIFYLHERIWLKINWSVKKKILVKAFTYEIVLGHFVLGLISLIVTGSWIQSSLISIVYIENKLWMYVLYDYLWSRTRNPLSFNKSY